MARDPGYTAVQTIPGIGPILRWAVVESVQRLPNHTVLGAHRDQVAARRDTNIGDVAAARRQLEYVDYALRDHHVHGLQPRPTTPTAPAAS